MKNNSKSTHKTLKSKFATGTVTVIVTLILLCAVLTVPANAEGFHAVETGVTSIMTIASDGSLTVDEQWTVSAYDGDINEIELSMPLTGDTLILDRTKLNLNRVSVNRLTVAESDAQTSTVPAYTASWVDNYLTIKWILNIPMGEFVVLGINYTIPNAVKSYNNSAWCAPELFSPPVEDYHYRNVSINIILPAQISSDSFKVSENGNLIVTKTTDGATLSAENLIGKARALVEMPLELFNNEKLTVIGDTGSGKTAAYIILTAALVALFALLIIYILQYKRIFYAYFEKRSYATDMPDVSNEEFNEFMKSQPPAQLLYALFPAPTNASDALAVTFIDLYTRGYINKSRNGFTAVSTSGLTQYERTALRLFTTEKSRIIADENKLRIWITKYNNIIPKPGPFDIFIPSKKRLYTRLFVMKRSAKGFNYISPGEISDSILREKKFTVFRLFISLIQENKMRSDGLDTEPKRKLGNDVFRLLRL